MSEIRLVRYSAPPPTGRPPRRPQPPVLRNDGRDYNAPVGGTVPRFHPPRDFRSAA